MIVVLTGGTGLLGNALGEALAGAGHQVRVLSRGGEAARASLGYPAEVYSWAGESEPAPAAALAGADAVIHLAGESVAGGRWTAKRKAVLRDSRLKTLERLIEGMKAHRPRVFISASAVGVYGDRGDKELTESSVPGRGFLAELCVDWESLAATVLAGRTVQLRIGVILSPYGGFLREVVPLFLRAGAARLGSGRQFVSWIHQDDAVAAILTALADDAIHGPVNLCAPNPVTNGELTRVLAGRLGVARVPAAPAAALRLLYGEMADMLLSSQRVRPSVLLERGFQFRYPDFAAAVGDIFDGAGPGEMILAYRSWVPRTRDELWPFFSSERNLERITPPFLSFRVLGKSTEEIEEGTLIDYKLKLKGVPIGWRSRISLWEPPEAFVDEQMRGPYAIWHHTHTFTPLAGGTRMGDRIRLKPPAGALGRAVSMGLILADVEKIFRYRARVIQELFGHR